MVMNPNLPEEILIEIFLRLPTKSIGRCRCLSKPWRAVLSSPSFIKSHLTRKTQQQNLLLVSDSGTLHTISAIKSDDKTVPRELDLSNTWNAVIGSCNGLVLLINSEYELFLVNPITRELVKIPDPPLALPKEGSTRVHGFGYDGSNDDYKILTLSSYHGYGRRRNWLVNVYSLKKGVWKRVNSSAGPLFGSGAFVNGIIHWLANGREPDDYQSVIVAFDFVKEVFYEIPAAPLGVDKSTFLFNILVVLGESLCVVGIRSSATDLSMLKEYGKVESWTKFSIHDEWKICKPLCLIGDEEFVLLMEDGRLVVYNVKEGCSRTLVVDGFQIMTFDGSTFRDSLLSPDFGNQIDGSK